MKDIKVLGKGCSKCAMTVKMIEQAAQAAGVEIRLEKVEDMVRIAGYGVMSTPAVVVDGKVVHAGGLPDKAKIAGWLNP